MAKSPLNLVPTTKPDTADRSCCPGGRRRGTLRSGRRAGLAPLELVMWLPVLLLVTALMVNYATLATWRVRGEIVSRDAAWRERWGRSGAREGRLDGVWPAAAAMGTVADPPVTQLDEPTLQFPVVRGPLPNRFVVRPLLDPDRVGAYRGTAAIDREYTFLPRLGDYHSGEIAGSLLDRKWNNSEMGIPNEFRRTKILYELPKTDPHLPRALYRAVTDLLRIPHFAALSILDHDPDVRKFTGRYVDFHPRVARMCVLDRDLVQQSQVNRIIDTRNARGGIDLGAISRLPRTMTDFFLNMYNRAIRWMQNRIQQLQNELRSVPPPSPQRQSAIIQEIAQLQAEIDRLQPKVTQLEQYRNRLPQLEADLQARAAAAIP